MQRRIEQPDRHRQALHDLEQLDEIRPLHRQQLGKRGAAGLLVLGENHLAHGADPGFLEEHVLGAAQPDALAAEFDGGARIVGGVGVDADAELAERIGPAHQRAEFAGHRRLDHRHPPGQHLAQRAVDGDDVAGLEGAGTDAHGAAAVIDADRAAAGDAGLAHAARDHRRMRGHAAAGGQNAFGGVHAVNVFGAGLDSHQNDLAAIGLQLGGFIGREHDFAGGRTRRSRQAGGDDVALGARDRWSDAATGRARRDRSATPLPSSRSGLHWRARQRCAALLSRCACRRGSAASTACPARP